MATMARKQTESIVSGNCCDNCTLLCWNSGKMPRLRWTKYTLLRHTVIQSLVHRQCSVVVWLLIEIVNEHRIRLMFLLYGSHPFGCYFAMHTNQFQNKSWYSLIQCLPSYAFLYNVGGIPVTVSFLRIWTLLYLAVPNFLGNSSCFC